jgi:hypothetical protein
MRHGVLMMPGTGVDLTGLAKIFFRRHHESLFLYAGLIQI